MRPEHETLMNDNPVKIIIEREFNLHDSWTLLC